MPEVPESHHGHGITPCQRGFCFNVCTFWLVRSPLTLAAGVCLAPRVACLVVGERVQGLPSARSELGLCVPLLVRLVGRGCLTPIHGRRD